MILITEYESYASNSNHLALEIMNKKGWALGVGIWKLKLKLILTLCFCFLFFTFYSFSQGVGINAKGVSANSKTLLDIDAVGTIPKAGLILPRMTTAERNAITSPVPESLLIYNTDTHCFEAYYNGVWVAWGCLNCQLPFAPVAGIHIPSPTQIVWNWSSVSEAKGYQWNTSSTYPGIGVNVVSNPTYIQTGLICNTVYNLYIWSYNNCGNSSSIKLAQKTSCCDCGGFTTMTDSRDGQVYNIVKIGSQCWMAQNLNYGTFVPVATGEDSSGTQKYCYDDNPVNCINYGGIYEWQEMMDGVNKNNTGAISSSCNGTSPPPDINTRCTTLVHGICPSGWHVPSYYEWILLERNVGSDPTAFAYNPPPPPAAAIGLDEGANLLSGGTSCFEALLAGRSVNGGTSFGSFSFGHGTSYPMAAFWGTTFFLTGSSTPPHNEYSCSPILWPSIYPNQIYQQFSNCFDGAFGYSVRCVKD